MELWPTFWKPQELPRRGSVEIDLEPLGDEKDVMSRLLSIPRTHPWINLMDGYSSFFWCVLAVFTG